ncbi:DsbA family oxidoreductase [Arenimonas composti]|uniref:DSBA-like thioredoxin domain-containing protein n=1 Tax=Arenimonas composti TR7-09 = DSM 18010 TaxID=1121013 RepID=A0A091BDB6_9GAMM|nr:DsbA family oxidoreductase [Arenimonas composti]KFN49487.1 hypothetical protein P873_10970 [Arenimonas composti TR7-09 = DSM 18010]
MTTPLRIDFVSDIVCPWCAIGLSALEAAIRRVGDAVTVALHVQPFELNPGLGPAGEDLVAHLQKKYAIGAAQIAASQEAIRQRGAELGFTFAPERRRIHDTFDGHRLLHWAGIEGGGRQLALKRALLAAYFTDGRDVSDHAVLVEAAGSVGLDLVRAREVLGNGEFADEVRAAEKFFVDAGIRGVPAIIFNRTHLISGGQPVEVFERALRQLA